MSKKGFLMGFTLLEILVVLMILGFLTAMVAGHFSRIKGEAAIVTALNEMKDIKEAIRDRFYPDMGLIPEDVANPEWATRFLCLTNDGSGDINVVTGVCSGSDDCIEMCEFLKTKFNNEKVKSYLHWDKYSRKGWRGPYLEREITAYDDKGTPVPADDEWYPLIIDSWGKSVDYSVDPDGVIGEYRIIYDEIDGTSGITREDERLSTRIISFGANGVDNGGATTPLPLPADTGDDLVMFIFGTQPMRRP